MSTRASAAVGAVATPYPSSREDLLERGANFRLVIDHEDMIHERASVRGVALALASGAGGSA